MRSINEQKYFIQLRAEGKSHEFIAQQLGIARSTCAEWENQLCGQIEEYKKREIQELGESYGMVKEARVRSLGKTLKRLDEAIDVADFSSIDPAKLLELKLRYMDALGNEISSLNPEESTEEISVQIKNLSVTQLQSLIKQVSSPSEEKTVIPAEVIEVETKEESEDMNKQAFELYKVTEEDFKSWCISQKLRHYEPESKQKFFAALQDGKLVRNRDGKLVRSRKSGKN